MGELLKFDVRERSQAQYLATRSTGRAMREDLEDQISREHPEGALIDFAGVEAMTISFADEFVGRFYAALAAGDIHVPSVQLVGLNEENLEAVSICLERRELAAAAVIGDQPVLLSPLEYLVETYRRALNLGTFSAIDLSDVLGISPQNINNRLQRLVKAGAVRRRRVASNRGGKEFAYTAPPQLPEPTACR